MAGLEGILKKYELKKELLDMDYCYTEHLQKLAEMLESWEQLALQLGLSEAEVTAIKRDRSTSQKSLSALIKWRDKPRNKHDKKATYLVLAETLVEIGRSDLADELVKQIVPQATARKIVGTLVQTIYDEFEGFNVSEIIKGGSLGHGTVVLKKYDIDLVVYSREIDKDKICERGGDYREWLTQLDDFLERTFKHKYVKKGNSPGMRSLQFRFDDTLDVDLLVSPYWENDSKDGQDQHKLYKYLKTIRGKKSRKKRFDFSVSASKWQVQFLAKQPPQVKEMIRKAKEWRNREWEDDGEGRPSSYLMSLLVVAAYEHSQRTKRSVTDTIKELVKGRIKLQKGKMNVCWAGPDEKFFYQRRDYPGLLPPRPRVVDPANPANNVWVTGLRDCNPGETPSDYEPGDGNQLPIQAKIDSIKLK